MKWTRFAPAFAAGALVLAACADTDTTAPITAGPELAVSAGAGKSYVILAAGNSLPDGLADLVARAGGTLTGTLPQVGVAFATSADASFAGKTSRIKGVTGVAEDIIVQWVRPSTVAEELEGSDFVGAEGHQVGGHETFRLMQWAPDAVSAPAAWATGAMGAGARVAILDGGINNNHIDIAPNLDAARSTSFVPGQPYNFDTGTFWHGTHVAGIVAAPANNVGTVGIAPQATLVGVKVLHGGSGAFSWVMSGIVYAATPISRGGAGAHIINMSLGGSFAIGDFGAGAALLMSALNRTVTYAYQQGVLVVSAAGNSAVDFDHTADLVFVPAQSTNSLAISATGPLGFGLGNTNYDLPASYTNYGQSAISFAGPGGDFDFTPASQMCSIARLDTGALITRNCWVFDMVMAPFGAANNTFGWAAGTSMATPAVSGVAALVVGKYGPMHPARLAAILRASADDLGKPGNDDFYGAGRVNAWRAVQ